LINKCIEPYKKKEYQQERNLAMNLEPKVKRRIDTLLNDHPLIKSIVKKIHEQGGRALLVGGAVRDSILGIPTKDIDIEVHGISLQSLEDILKEFGTVNSVGKAFGVQRLTGLDVDWSLPRTDEAGRKPRVIIDPSMNIERAFRRRDLTINAMGIDIMNYELLDPFGGMQDLQKGILRTPDIRLFLEDPLRFFRVMQFCARFCMQPDEELNSLCSSMDISGVSHERIEGEFKKLFLKSLRPSLGFRWLDHIGRLKDVLPELAATKGIPQNPHWHPEGDVFEHTMQTIDAAAALFYKSENEKLVILYAALCHDLGKVTTTQKIDGTLKSYGHEKESERLAKKLLKRIMRNKELIMSVSKLVRYHMQPIQFVEGGAKPSAYKRLALKLSPEATLEMLGKLALADKQGRNPQKGLPLKESLPDVDAFLKKAQEAHVLYHIEKPILQGRDLLDVMQPGPEIGALVKRAYQIQLEEGILDKDELKKRVLA
jgi:tRNA nucleotidyltransferase (CCA-adding enzyme)